MVGGGGFEVVRELMSCCIHTGPCVSTVCSVPTAAYVPGWPAWTCAQASAAFRELVAHQGWALGGG